VVKHLVKHLHIEKYSVDLVAKYVAIYLLSVCSLAIFISFSLTMCLCRLSLSLSPSLPLPLPLPLPLSHSNVKFSTGDTPLIIAAQNNHVDIVQYLIEHGADLESRGMEGRTACQWAAKKRHSRVVTYLVSVGADIDSDAGVCVPLQLVSTVSPCLLISHSLTHSLTHSLLRLLSISYVYVCVCVCANRNTKVSNRSL
jgi:ankyrin repeat protein